MLQVNLPVLGTMYNLPIKKKVCYGCGAMGDSGRNDSIQVGKLRVHVHVPV